MLQKRVGHSAPDRSVYRMVIMNRYRNSLTAITMFAALIFCTAAVANAQKRNDRDVRDAVRSLNSNLDNFESNLRYQMQSSSSNTSNINDFEDKIRTLRDNVGQFQDNFDRKRENGNDVRAIIDAARPINDFLLANPQGRGADNDWRSVQKQIDRLAANYGVTASWNTQQDPNSARNYPTSSQPVQKSTYSVGLSGTYDLDQARSEKIDDIVAETNVASDQRQDLKDKLEAPEQIAIDIRGNQITIATTTSTPVVFTADGREQTEKSSTGKTVRLRATLNGQVLTVSSLGGETDYTITFTSVSNGQGLKVSRRITTDYLKQTVFAESVYNKTDAVATLGIQPGGSVDQNSGNGGRGVYSDNDNSGNVSNGGSNTGANGGSRTNSPRVVQVRPGNYIVPDGVTMTGILENEINTKVSQNNDRFRMTVQSPDEFRGATVEGYVSGINRSGKITGRSAIVFNFEKITLRDGQTYDFAATLRGITDVTGKAVQVDNEGTAKGDNQTKQTAKRGGIGAGIGAVIGAIAGGAQGAAIGAIIGAGGGAGSVAVQGRSDIQLMKGSVMTIQAAAPTQQNPR